MLRNFQTLNSRPSSPTLPLSVEQGAWALEDDRQGDEGAQGADRRQEGQADHDIDRALEAAVALIEGEAAAEGEPTLPPGSPRSAPFALPEGEGVDDGDALQLAFQQLGERKPAASVSDRHDDLAGLQPLRHHRQGLLIASGANTPIADHRARNAKRWPVVDRLHVAVLAAARPFDVAHDGIGRRALSEHQHTRFCRIAEAQAPDERHPRQQDGEHDQGQGDGPRAARCGEPAVRGRVCAHEQAHAGEQHERPGQE